MPCWLGGAAERDNKVDQDSQARAGQREGSAIVEITLRDVRDSDLPVFWAQMSDERARHMAAVTRGYHYDRAAFDAHWDKVRSDPAVIVRTVLADGEVAGHAAVFGPRWQRRAW